MKTIKVLGPGCAKCEQLAKAAKQAADEIGIEYEFEKVTDIMEITTYGVLFTPALVIDGEVRVTGRVPTTDEIKDIIQ